MLVDINNPYSESKMKAMEAEALAYRKKKDIKDVMRFSVLLIVASIVFGILKYPKNNLWGLLALTGVILGLFIYWLQNKKLKRAYIEIDFANTTRHFEAMKYESHNEEIEKKYNLDPKGIHIGGSFKK